MLPAGDNFGFSVAVGSNKIVVGSIDSNNDSGSVYVYNLDGTGEVKITASDGAQYDQFGCSVSVGNDKIVVGARLDDLEGGESGGSASGSAYIYDLDGTNEVKLTASDAAVVITLDSQLL